MLRLLQTTTGERPRRTRGGATAPPPRYRARRPARGRTRVPPTGPRRWRRARDAGRPDRRQGPADPRTGTPDRRTGPIDRRTGPIDRRARGLIGRARELARRFRDPLIGLALAGAAAPLARAGKRSPGLAPAVEGELEQEARSAALGAHIATTPAAERRTAEERERADTVRTAVRRYGIDRRLAEDIYDIATEEGIDPALAFGLVKVESDFRHRAISPVGARGLTQLMPRTARWLLPGITNEDLFNRHINLRLGFRYLRQLIEDFGDLRLALLAYNRGPGIVERILREGGDPDNGYADRVLAARVA